MTNKNSTDTNGLVNTQNKPINTDASNSKPNDTIPDNFSLVAGKSVKDDNIKMRF